VFDSPGGPLLAMCPLECLSLLLGSAAAAAGAARPPIAAATSPAVAGACAAAISLAPRGADPNHWAMHGAARAFKMLVRAHGARGGSSWNAGVALMYCAIALKLTPPPPDRGPLGGASRHRRRSRGGSRRVRGHGRAVLVRLHGWRFRGAAPRVRGVRRGGAARRRAPAQVRRRVRRRGALLRARVSCACVGVLTCPLLAVVRGTALAALGHARPRAPAAGASARTGARTRRSAAAPDRRCWVGDDLPLLGTFASC
jgi:hypothetical protein